MKKRAPAPAPNRTDTPAPQAPKRERPGDLTEGMSLLAEGYKMGKAAELLGVDRTTLRRWRFSARGREAYDRFLKAREADLAEAAARARRVLLDSAELAATRLVDRLHSTVPFEAISAAEAVLGRTGLPRSTKTELLTASEIDPSKLNDDELAALERLQQKARV